MPPASQTLHNPISNPCFPYVSNTSVTDETPHFISGSQNLLTSIVGQVTRRPGFGAALEPTPTVLTAPAQWARIAGYETWGGAFFVMACATDSSATTSTVYKFRVGTDSSFIQIAQDTTSSVPFDFVVSNNTCYFGNGTVMKKFDGTTTSKWGIVSPAAAPTIDTATAGPLNTYTTAGWNYVYTYFNSNTGHESSPSPLSAATGIITSKEVKVTVVASADSQVTNIRIYRSTDGGSTDPVNMQEIPNSPFPNTSTQQIDTAVDTALLLRFAPEFFRNDPPTASVGFVWHAGRLFSFANNTVYFSGFEEIVNGVPEESWPSGLAGNKYPYAKKIQALAELSDGVTPFTPSSIEKIEGDSLDTFRRYTLSKKQGTRAVTLVTSYGDIVMWFDTTATIWMLGGNEISIPIRPDLKVVVQSNADVALHLNGSQHWFLVVDTTNSKMFVFDFDTKMWLSPWTVKATSIASIETSAGNYDLLIGHSSGKVLKLTASKYNDNGVAYSPVAITELMNIGVDSNPQWRGAVDYFGMETDGNLPIKVEQIVDENPAIGTTWADITKNIQDADLRTPGTYLVEKYYKSMPQTNEGRRAAFRITWPTTDTPLTWYASDVAHHVQGG